MEVSLPITVNYQLPIVNCSLCGNPPKESNVFSVMDKKNISAEEMKQAIARGDKKAFEQLFREWYAPLCIYAESIVHDRDLAEDLVQGIFCALWEKRESMVVRESLKSYLYRSVYHAALNSLKHDKVKLAFLEFLQKQGIGGENNIEYLMNTENQEKMIGELKRAIGLLPDQCREIFMLSRFEGKKSQEIAMDLNLSLRTVEAQLYRAMKRLREELAHLKNSTLLLFILAGYKPIRK